MQDVAKNPPPSDVDADLIAEASDSVEPQPAGIGHTLAVLAVGSALLMQFIDQTALSTALPTLAHAFNIEAVNLKLVLTSYILVQAVIVPASGWAADRLGARGASSWRPCGVLAGLGAVRPVAHPWASWCCSAWSRARGRRCCCRWAGSTWWARARASSSSSRWPC